MSIIEDGAPSNFVWVCEDGVWKLVLAVSSYPNALLVDGSRAWTGTQTSKSIVFDTNNTYNIGESARRLKNINVYNILNWNYMKASGNSVIYTADDRYLSFGSALAAGDQLVAQILEGRIDIPRAGDITVLASKALNFGNNPILYSPLKHICAFSLAAGATDVYVQTIPAGEMTQDMHVSKVIVSIDAAVGDGKTVTVSVSDGTNTMTVSITGTEDVTGSTTTNAFDLDVSAETLTLQYSQSAGGGASAGTIICVHHYITNV